MTARFLKSATRKDQYPRSHLPKIAFAGRSNVGKSSLINKLVGREGLARISSTPGRTQVINFFNINNRWIFVDLPGYGFAKVPERIRSRWASMIEEFFEMEKRLDLALLIVDVRHPPSELDQMMKQWLEERQIPYQVVGTKADKLSSIQVQKSLEQIRKVLGVDEVIPFSARTGKGKKELWRAIQAT